jgi:hypothetical protein
MTGTASCDYQGAAAVARTSAPPPAAPNCGWQSPPGPSSECSASTGSTGSSPFILPGRRYCRRGASSNRPCDAPAGRPACGAASEASRIRGQSRGGDRAGGGQVSTAALPGPLRSFTAQLDELRSGDVPDDPPPVASRTQPGPPGVLAELDSTTTAGRDHRQASASQPACPRYLPRRRRMPPGARTDNLRARPAPVRAPVGARNRWSMVNATVTCDPAGPRFTLMWSAIWRTSHSPWPGSYGHGDIRAAAPGRWLPGVLLGRPELAGPGSLTWQISSRLATLIRRCPVPPPCSTAFAASSCTASITSSARPSAMPAAVACASTVSRRTRSVVSPNSWSSMRLRPTIPPAAAPRLFRSPAAAVR